MLHLIIGRSSSGKTTLIRKIISEKLDSGEKVALLVPEQFSFESEKGIISMFGAQKASQMGILSFTSLSEKILNEYEKNRKPPVTDAARAVIMSLAIENLSESLTIFKRSGKNKKTVSGLLNIIDEMAGGGVLSSDIIKASENAGSATLAEKAREIDLISQMYGSLIEKSFSDDRYIINKASAIIAEKSLFKDYCVFFDEFMSFTSQERLMLSEIVKNAKDVYITQCADGIHDKSGGSGVFSYSLESINNLISLSNKSDVKISKPVILNDYFGSSHNSIKALEKGVYEPSPEVYNEPCDNIITVSAPNLYDECEFAAVTAKKLIREKGLRYRDIVVVARSDGYLRNLPFAFKKYDIPVFMDRRRTLDSELIVLYAESALTLAANGISTDSVFRYLRTYLTNIPREDIDELENYTFMWQINYSSWQTEWKNHPLGIGNEFDEKAKEKLKLINETRKKVIEPVIKLKNDIEGKTGEEAVKALYCFLIDTGSDKNLLSFALTLDNENAYECERSWDEFMTALSLLADITKDKIMTTARFLELFKIMTSSSDIGSLPGSLDEITVGSADRIRVENKKVLFLLGANEGIFPREPNDVSILSGNERRLLKNQSVDLGGGSEELVMKERLNVYRTLAIPKDLLFISYSSGDLSGSASLPSEIVTMVDKIIPRHKKINYSLLPEFYFVESKKSAFDSALSHYSDNTIYSESLKSYVFSTDDYLNSREYIDKSVKKTPVKINDKNIAIDLFGEKMYVTPSRIEEYYKCPFRYFCRYGLKAFPVGKSSFDPKIRGLLVHYTLENLFSRFGSKGLTELTPNEREQYVSESVWSYAEKYMGGKENLPERLIYSVDRSRKIILTILERLVSEFNACLFETRDVELKIGYDGKIKPYIIKSESGEIVISGIVDRIDTMNASGDKVYIRVIDYKTGGKDFNLNDVLSGLNIQTLIYLICLTENGKERYGDMIPAGILYVPATKIKSELPRNSSNDSFYELLIKNSRMKGMILNDPKVVLGMDPSGKGRLIEAKIKDGEVTGKTFTLSRFALLHRVVDKIIKDAATFLHNGRIEAKPILDGDYKNTCEYCDYKTVCRREESDDYETLFKGDAWTQIEKEACDD